MARRINDQETVLLKQTSDDRYYRVIKVLHALAPRYGSAVNAAKILIQGTDEYKDLESQLFPIPQDGESCDNGRNPVGRDPVTPVCDMRAEYKALRARSDNGTSR